MEYTALWGPKGFIISPSKIVPLMNLSTSFSVKTDSGNTTGGSSTTNMRGRELQTLSLSTLYVRGAGVDPRGQIAEWEAQVGNAYPLYIQGQRFGPSKLVLKSVDVSDVLLSNAGVFLQCAVSLQFEEYATEAVKTKTTTNSTTAATQAASTYNKIVEQKKEALNATAKPQDKAVKKTTSKVVMLR